MFPGKLEINQNKQCNVVTLRSGAQLEDPKMRKDINQNIKTETIAKAKSPCAKIEDKDKVKDNEEEEPKYIAPKPCMPPIPFFNDQLRPNLIVSLGSFQKFKRNYKSIFP